MAKRSMTSHGWAGWLALSGVVLAIVFFVAVPLLLVMGQAIQGSRPAGFGRGLGSLAVLSARSVAAAVLPTAAVTTLCVCLSGLSYFSPLFRRFYRFWLVILLFTNPVFFVFGFTILMASVTAPFAVGVTTMYILLPLVGLIVQSAVDELPRELISTARALGSSPVGSIWRHILPGIWPSIVGALLLGSVYALGFYMVPSFVGQGHVSTLGTAIDHAANQIGDWGAACQLALVTLLAQVVVVGGLMGVARLATRSSWALR